MGYTSLSQVCEVPAEDKILNIFFPFSSPGCHRLSDSNTQDLMKTNIKLSKQLSGKIVRPYEPNTMPLYRKISHFSLVSIHNNHDFRDHSRREPPKSSCPKYQSLSMHIAKTSAYFVTIWPYEI